MSLRPPPVNTQFDKNGTPAREWVQWVQEASRHIHYLGYNTTANRPINGMATGDVFYDTTLGFPVWWNGSAWAVSVFAGAVSNSSVSVTSADASTTTGTATDSGLASSFGFVSAAEFNAAITAINTIKTLANECKADINTLVTDVNALRNALRTAGIIS